MDEVKQIVYEPPQQERNGNDCSCHRPYESLFLAWCAHHPQYYTLPIQI